MNDTGEGVYPDVGCISRAEVRKLRLFIVSLNPNVALDQVDYLHARRHQLPGLDVPLSNRAVGGSGNFRVVEVHLGDDNRSFFGLNVGEVTLVLGVESGALPLFRFELRPAAGE